ncbi:hypothetical protein [Anaerococcus sp.]|uniref:hypothetical protein n=1 Tax=Anaerococcus TaxID=165779 RepID=UPI00280B78C2|nr:hypothetical protein [Anaerococcus sp.]MDU3177285.1 hypothetical protein [Anaerococcus sp.]
MTDNNKRTFESGNNDKSESEKKNIKEDFDKAGENIKESFENTNDNIKKEVSEDKDRFESDVEHAKTNVENDFDYVKNENKNEIDQAKNKIKSDVDHANTEVKNDFDELNHHTENKEANNDEKVDTSDYKRVNTEGDKTHHNHKNDSKVDIKNSKNKASEDKPFYSNWWFWVLLVIILWAIWYFGFRNPNTI